MQLCYKTITKKKGWMEGKMVSSLERCCWRSLLVALSLQIVFLYHHVSWHRELLIWRWKRGNCSQLLLGLWSWQTDAEVILTSKVTGTVERENSCSQGQLQCLLASVLFGPHSRAPVSKGVLCNECCVYYSLKYHGQEANYYQQK